MPLSIQNFLSWSGGVKEPKENLAKFFRDYGAAGRNGTSHHFENYRNLRKRVKNIGGPAENVGRGQNM